jgi:hypothetical protein
VAVVFLLLVSSIDGVDAKKKGGKGSKKKAAAAAAAAAATASDVETANVASTSTTEAIDATQAAAASVASTPDAEADPSPVDVEAAAARRLRRRELVKKRKEKKAATLATNLRAAKTRNAALAQKRAAKIAREAKNALAAKTRADELVAKKRAADTPDIRRKGHEKLKWLLSASAKSGSRVISMDTATYNAYVNEGPRPYFLLMQYTALTSAHSCQYCHMANDAIVPVAQANYEHNKALVAGVLASNSTADLPESSLPVFFATVDMARNGELFKEIKYSSAPTILLAPPRLGTKTLKSLDFVRTLAPRYRFNLQASMSSGDFQGFVNKLAARHVQLDAVKPGLGDLLVMLVVLSGIAAVAFKYGLTVLHALREMRGVKNVVLVLGLVLYCWCIAGGMYNVIRGTQFADVQKDGTTNYINGDARDQFAAEGLIIGVLNVGAALALVMLNTRAFDDSYATGGSGAAAAGKAKLTPLGHLKNALSPLFTPVVCSAIALALWYRVLAIYSIKNRGYRYGFVWRT